jgi:hypothetical protein
MAWTSKKALKVAKKAAAPQIAKADGDAPVHRPG